MTKPPDCESIGLKHYWWKDAHRPGGVQRYICKRCAKHTQVIEKVRAGEQPNKFEEG